MGVIILSTMEIETAINSFMHIAQGFLEISIPLVVAHWYLNFCILIIFMIDLDL